MPYVSENPAVSVQCACIVKFVGVVQSLLKYPEAHRHWPIDVAPAAFVPENGGQGSQVKSSLPPHEPTEYWFLRQDVGLRHGAHVFEVEALPEDTM